jgi:hypothetical protein
MDTLACLSFSVPHTRSEKGFLLKGFFDEREA